MCCMEKKSNLSTNLKKATIEMLLLKLLSEEDMYGYQMSQELKKRSNGQYTVLEGSMYPILYRLTDQNHISFFEKKVGRRQTRVYYHLEESGARYFQELQESFSAYIGMIQFLLISNEGDVYEQFGETDKDVHQGDFQESSKELSGQKKAAAFIGAEYS